MKRYVTKLAGAALAVTLVGASLVAVEAARGGSPPQSTAFGKTLTEWMQLYWTWALGGGGDDHVGHVKFLQLPSGEYAGGSFTYADPGVLVGHLDVSLKPGTPFVLPVSIWYGETYLPALGYPDDPPLPADLFTDPGKNLIRVSIDGKPVMDSTRASVAPFYFGPAPIDVVYPAPSSYGSTAAIFVQGIGFVHEPLSVGTHKIELLAGLRVPPDPTILNLNVYPDGSGIVFKNTWTITVAP
jgi:hypothetical protein